MNEITDKLIKASKALQEIPVKGQDTLRMATALTLIEQAVQELAKDERIEDNGRVQAEHNT